MDGRLKLVIFCFFLFLLLFITIMMINEFKNMDKLKTEYENLPEEVYQYRKEALWVWGIRLILQFLIPLLFLLSRFSQRLDIWANRGRTLFLSGFLYGIIFFAILFIINLPLNYFSSFYLRHKYGLSNQSILRWLEVNLKNFLVGDGVISLFLWIPLYIIYKNPRTWWFNLSIIVIPIIIFMVFITPMIIDPIFNKYTSIEDENLEKEIINLLNRADISDAKIYKVDKSKDTKTMNAYMTGIFKSKRIVLWDTTINKLEQSEVLVITAHEIGHYVRGHIWKSIILSSCGTVLMMILLYITSNWILALSNGVFGIRNIHDLAAIPLLLIVLNFYTFLGNPLMNYVSRQMEKEADAYEITLTRDRESAISAMEKLHTESLGIPRPSNLYKIWYHTHPTLEERLEFYNTYKIK